MDVAKSSLRRLELRQRKSAGRVPLASAVGYSSLWLFSAARSRLCCVRYRYLLAFSPGAHAKFRMIWNTRREITPPKRKARQVRNRCHFDQRENPPRSFAFARDDGHRPVTFASLAPFAGDIPTFACRCAALGSSWWIIIHNDTLKNQTNYLPLRPTRKTGARCHRAPQLCRRCRDRRARAAGRSHDGISRR